MWAWQAHKCCQYLSCYDSIIVVTLHVACVLWGRSLKLPLNTIMTALHTLVDCFLYVTYINCNSKMID